MSRRPAGARAARIHPPLSVTSKALLEGGTDGRSISAVARRLRVTGAFITTEVAKLCGKDLVQKRADPSDGRGVLLRLVPPGEQALARLADKVQRINDEYFRDVSASGFAASSDFVEKLVANGERTLHFARGLPAAGDRRAAE